MATYYEDAYLTISAMDSRDCHGGFLEPRTPTPLVVFPNLNHSNVYLRRQIQGTAQTLGNAPISERAWCYQERLLSKGILHFGQCEIIWESMTCGRRESTEEVTIDKDNTDLLSVLIELVGLFDPKENIDGMERILCLLPSNSNITPPSVGTLHFWYYLIEDFSSRKLKYQSDKIPSILGLVEKVRQATSLEFCHGLWRGDILRAYCGVQEIDWYYIHTRATGIVFQNIQLGRGHVFQDR
jgi:hypothetical protein